MDIGLSTFGRKDSKSLFPQLLRPWPLLQSYNFEAYAFPENHVLFALRDKAGGIPAGPSQLKPSPFETYPPLPPKPQDLPLWQFFMKSKFSLGPADAGFLLPGYDCGNSGLAGDYMPYSVLLVSFWVCQIDLCDLRSAMGQI